MLSKSSVFVTVLSAVVFGAPNDRTKSARFTHPGVSINEAPAANILEFQTYPYDSPFARPLRTRRATRGSDRKSIRKRQHGNLTVNTIFAGVYPVINVTWGNKDGKTGQSFVSFIDTGSSDTFAVASNFQCVDINTKAPRPQAGCGFGPLYDKSLGAFTNITSQKFEISYYPENESLEGSMGYSPIILGGLTVPKQEVALVDYAAWAGDTYTSGLIGLAYPAVTSVSSRSGLSAPIKYDPVFTTMAKEGIVKDAVFSLAIDRVPPGTPPSTPAGMIAFGGLVPDKYYDGPFTSVPIELTQGIGKNLTFYTTTHELLYGLANGTIVSGGKYQSIVDSGTAPNMIPSAAAADLNKQWVPPAVYNSTLGYWVVDCNATAPYAAFKIGGKIMPMDPKDMIVRSLNGLIGYENTCFSAFGDGGDPTTGQMIIGAVWQRGYVVAYDQGRSMIHFAARKPY